MKKMLLIILLGLAVTLNLYSSSTTISGIVMDTAGVFQSDVIVRIENTIFVTKTDENGVFSLDIPNINDISKANKLLISKFGYRGKRINISFKHNEFMNIMLLRDVTQLIESKDKDVNTFIGIVVDEKGNMVSNAYIYSRDGTFIKQTDRQGQFAIETNKSKYKIKIEHLLYESQSVTLSDKNEVSIIFLKKAVHPPDIVDSPLMPNYERPGILSRLGLKKEKPTTTPPPSSDRMGAKLEMRAHASEEADRGDFGSHIDWEPSATSKSNAQAGLLTAGEVNDFSKWEFWTGIAARDLATYSEFWAIKPEERYTVQLENSMRNPIVNVKVRLLNNNDIIWQARTDNTGKAELWANPYTKYQTEINELSVEVEYDNEIHKLTNIKKFQDGINFLKIEAECNYPKNIDIAFVVDATGSMGDEIDYLKAELADIIHKVKDSLPDFDVKVSILFYRDRFDDYLTRHIDFTSDVEKLVSYISAQTANGGGDTPEAVDAAFEVTLNSMSWRENTLTKMLFLILDAPPHHTDNSRESLLSSISQFSEMGVRIIPLACSGMGKSTEYLMRSYSLLTNGTYLFLTDDSGIGGKHIEPTTDEYTVKLLNDLLFRTIYRFAYIPECKAPEIAKQDTLIVVAGEKKESRNDIIPSDENIVNQDSQVDLFAKEIAWKYYPNPTDGILNIEFTSAISELYITDITGKIIYRLNNITASPLIVNLTEYPNGIYFIRYEYSPDEWISGKFMISR